MNIILRFKNKAVLTALIGAVVALVYQVLALIGITPSIAENQIIEIAGLFINVLVLLGIVVDPTTKGVGDSKAVMNYQQPRGDK